MPNGKQGDHPITDIIHYRLPVFGQAIDDLIREIREGGGEAELAVLADELLELDDRHRFGGGLSVDERAGLERRLKDVRDRVRPAHGPDE
jgi:hypothetical protein